MAGAWHDRFGGAFAAVGGRKRRARRRKRILFCADAGGAASVADASGVSRRFFRLPIRSCSRGRSCQRERPCCAESDLKGTGIRSVTTLRAFLETLAKTTTSDATK